MRAGGSVDGSSRMLFVVCSLGLLSLRSALRSAYPSMLRCSFADTPSAPVGHVLADHRSGASVSVVADLTGATSEVWTPIRAPSPIFVRLLVKPS